MAPLSDSSPTAGIDESPGDSPSPLGGSSDEFGRPRVDLVKGRRPRLTRETEHLLRRRLKAAALVFFGGSAAFALRSLLRSVFGSSSAPSPFDIEWMFVAVFGGCLVVLSGRRRVSMKLLRLVELVLFASPAVYLTINKYSRLIDGDVRQNSIWWDLPVWFVLIFTYAMFIPNTWRRAAWVVGPMAAVPFVLPLGVSMAGRMPEGVAWTRSYQSNALIMFVAVVTATYGIRVINSLRSEIFIARQFGQYRLKRLLGTGAMGEVYLAEHQLLARPCAVKIIQPRKSGDRRALARFEREVRTTAQLSHWNIVEIFDYGRTMDGRFYYVMEYLPGLSLAELVERYGPMPPSRVIHLLRQASDALGEAHARGLIHCDITPGNIFVARRGGRFDVVKLLDFGLVKAEERPRTFRWSRANSITGSPLYMSPEQALDESEPDRRSDVYALGAVGYFLLCGQPPFVGDQPMKVLVAHVHDQPRPPSELASGIPQDLEDVILRCLAKKPEERFEDTRSLEEALAECSVAADWTRDCATDWWRQRSELAEIIAEEP